MDPTKRRLAVLFAGLLSACGSGGTAPPGEAQEGDSLQVLYPDGRAVAGALLEVQGGPYLCGRSGRRPRISRVGTDGDGVARLAPSAFPRLVSLHGDVGGLSRFVAPAAEGAATRALVVEAARLRVRVPEGPSAEDATWVVAVRAWRDGDGVTPELLLASPPEAAPEPRAGSDVALEEGDTTVDLFVPPGALCLLALGTRSAGPARLAGRERWVRVAAAGDEHDVELVAGDLGASGRLAVDARLPDGRPFLAGDVALGSLSGLELARWSLDAEPHAVPAGWWRARVVPSLPQAGNSFALPWAGTAEVHDGSTTDVQARVPEGGRVRLRLDSAQSELQRVTVIARDVDGRAHALYGAWAEGDGEAWTSFALGPVPCGVSLLARGVLPPGRWTVSVEHGTLAAESVSVEIRGGAVCDAAFRLLTP